jgi:hypothetical protein
MAHTPGPWRRTINGNRYIEVVGADGEPVVGWSGFDDSIRPIKVHQANARLIAQAPDMLTALKDFVDVTEGDGAVKRFAQSIIAKAEGRT